MSVTTKAERLIAQGSVHPQGCAAVLEVVGDSGTYRVILGDGFATCDCAASAEACSHVLAARLFLDGLASERASRHVARLVTA
jgi:hypothetical protein